MRVSDGDVKFPFLIGPTAGGKSALAVAVGRALGGPSRAEIVTADAFQIYKGMDIGTAKPTEAERGGFAHHVIDVVEPEASFTVHDWLSCAERAIGEIRARGSIPIVVGGTHLYAKAFMDGLFEGPAADPNIRARLAEVSQEERRAELERVDPEAAKRIHAADVRRTVRAIEVFRQTGSTISSLQKQWDAGRTARPGCVLVGLDWPAERVNPRINLRVRQMVADGLVEEARELWARGRLGFQAREALGYKQLIEHFEGRCSLDDAIEKIKIETRRFGKNQRTWLRRLRSTPGSAWISCPEPVEGAAAEAVLTAIGRG